MKEIGSIDFSDEDRKFAKELENTLEDKKSIINALGAPKELIDKTLHDKPVEEPFGVDDILAGSTDVGDVSWITPVGHLGVATRPIGTPAHSWQSTAASGSGIGFKGLHYAAKTMAGTLVDLYMDNNILQKAKKEFEEDRGDKKYKSPLLEGTELSM